MYVCVLLQIRSEDIHTLVSNSLLELRAPIPEQKSGCVLQCALSAVEFTTSSTADMRLLMDHLHG